jgi:hypothetical protein
VKSFRSKRFEVLCPNMQLVKSAVVLKILFLLQYNIWICLSFTLWVLIIVRWILTCLFISIAHVFYPRCILKSFVGTMFNRLTSWLLRMKLVFQHGGHMTRCLWWKMIKKWLIITIVPIDERFIQHDEHLPCCFLGRNNKQLSYRHAI